NPLSIGSIGIRFGGSAFTEAAYKQPAQKPLAINTDITLAADQLWQMGGTFGTINPNDSDSTKANQSLSIDQSRDVHRNTVDTNADAVPRRAIARAQPIDGRGALTGPPPLRFDQAAAARSTASRAPPLLPRHTSPAPPRRRGTRRRPLLAAT